MSLDQLIALLVIAGSASITPGPNNALIASSSASHGIRAVFPQMAGVFIGFPIMVFVVGLFLGEIFQQSALLRQILQGLGIVVLLWMAWRTATAGAAGTADARKPLTFLQSAGFQWINPKGWTMIIAVAAQFVDPEHPIITAAICAVAFSAMGMVSMGTWSMAGQAMQRFLTSEPRRQAFNISMGSLIALSVLTLFLV